MCASWAPRPSCLLQEPKKALLQADGNEELDSTSYVYKSRHNGGACDRKKGAGQGRAGRGLTSHDEALASQGAALQLPLEGRALEVGHHQSEYGHLGPVLGH